ncbi:MAG: helix-turn-helix transcriptional regulator [Chitinispirillaceae bacterium]|nr:helix-turn-helix transcriptional regulator [Chitinispirillaceae bacterium]
MRKLVDAVHYIHTKKLYLLPPIVFSLLFLLSLYNRTLIVFPRLSSTDIEAFDDRASDGNSQLDLFSIDSTGISIAYTLRNKQQYPYAGIKLKLKKGAQFRNLSNYDNFSIDITSNIPQDLNVFIYTNIPGFTDESKLLTYRFLSKAFKCQNKFEQFTAPLKTFAVPTWWFVHNSLPDDSLPKETYREVAEIILENGYTNQVNIPYSFTLHKLSFHKNMFSRGVLWSGACGVWVILYILIFLMYKSSIYRNEKKVVISYEPLEVENSTDEQLNRVVACIAKEYKNPDLTVNRVASEAGVLPAKISQLLRENKSCSYKKYLNAIRIAEAKRLLLETDRNVVEIAGKVGYNNVTHFNRIFKETTGISPRQFRGTASDSEQ